jgi:F-type H+-transporting ATPase subunit a
MFIKISDVLHREFKVLLGEVAVPGITLVFTSLFYYVVLNNFMGLFPYIYTRTSHLSITLSISLPLWLSFIFYG